jgi:hypothetical protein
MQSIEMIHHTNKELIRLSMMSIKKNLRSKNLEIYENSKINLIMTIVLNLKILLQMQVRKLSKKIIQIQYPRGHLNLRSMEIQKVVIDILVNKLTI